MKLIDMTVTDFANEVDSNSPAPGGGSVSALASDIGVGLARMMAHLSFGKKKFEALDDATKSEFKSRFDKLGEIRAELSALVDKDTESFNEFMKALKMPKETEEEKAEKARVMEIVLKDACSVPMEIMEKCCEAIELIVEFGAKGSKLAISDAGVGAAFCKAALQGASLNVYINTKSMADREYAEELNRKADAMLEKYTKIADDTFNSVLGRLK